MRSSRDLGDCEALGKLMHVYATATALSLVTLVCTWFPSFAPGLLPFPVATLITAAITIAIVTFHFVAANRPKQGKGIKCQLH